MSLRRTLVEVTAIMGVLLMLSSMAFLLCGCGGGGSDPTASPIPSDGDWDLLPEEDKAYQNPSFAVGYTNPLAHLTVPQNPFLAPNGKNNMHVDGYQTDTYEVSGPVGVNTAVTSRAEALGLYVTVVEDSQGRLYATRAQGAGIAIHALHPETLELIAEYELPDRPDGWAGDPLDLFHDVSGGAYFVLDNQDRIIVGTYRQSIQIVEYYMNLAFVKQGDYDMSSYLVPGMPGTGDKMGVVIPDCNGLLWWISRYGMVGTLDPIDATTATVHTVQLVGEEIQNSFAVAEDGVYIISSHALYKFHADTDGAPVQAG
jgi:hypothetical protein